MSQQPRKAEPALPATFTTMEDILDGKQKPLSRVNVIGLVAGFQAPTATRGSDWKCQMRLYDWSIQYDHELFLEVHFFDSKEQMPSAECGDVVIVSQAKVQTRAGSLSLLTSRDTTVHIFSASKIPVTPADASMALMPSFKKSSKKPSQTECQFVSSIYHGICKERLPTKTEYDLMSVRSTNIRDKLTLLRDLREGNFCDLIAQVVRDPFDSGDKVMLWVSDFTENPALFHHAFAGADYSDGQDGDPFGYSTKFSKPKLPATGWSGPFGKRSIQLSCFEPHASAIRNHQIGNGSWVSLKNIHIKYGSNNANLEGYLREDRNSYGGKIHVAKLDPAEDPENINPHLKEALRRKRDYEKEKKHQLKSITEAAKAGQKRKSDMSSSAEPVKKNSKARRRAERARNLRNGEKQDAEKSVPASDLNSQIKCENQNKAASSVAQILETVYHDTTIEAQLVKLPLPFVNLNFRANVRIVDFRPSKLENFACPKKKPSEYAALSDTDDSDSGSASESEQEIMPAFTTEREWEWRFHLALEDATVWEKQEKKTVWVVVDNAAAQCLMSLDASNLKRDRENLDALREKLFLLWGNLEEIKSRRPSKITQNAKKGGPPLHSDDESHKEEDKAEQVANRPFACCIRQYGVKITEPESGKADAGESKRWQRMYGFFGARISGA